MKYLKMQQNLIRWKRLENQDLLLEVRENMVWKPYKDSINYVPDNCLTSNGYATFVNCLKHGYKVLKVGEQL